MGARHQPTKTIFKMSTFTPFHLFDIISKGREKDRTTQYFSQNSLFSVSQVVMELMDIRAGKMTVKNVFRNEKVKLIVT